MSKFPRLTSAALFVLLSSAMAAAQGRVECGTVKSAALARSVRYCAMLPPSYDKDKQRKFPILYHLHGLGGTEQDLVNFGGWTLVEDLQRQGKVGEFIMVTPDAGRSFYINAISGKAPYETFFVKEFMPAIEKRFRVEATRAKRGIGGISMGGYGALRFAFKYPNLFSSVSAHSPALLEKLPVQMIAAARARGRRGPPFLGEVFGMPPDQAFYERNTPFTLARQAKNLRGLKIYFDCGDRDEFGFAPGARALSDLLKQKKIEHEAHIYPGGHTWTYFAEHLDESLVFHSKAFGL